MKKVKDYLKKEGILSRISFKDGKEHIVKLIDCKEVTITDANGEERRGMKFKVTEGGEPKTFFTSSVGLLTKLAEIPENSVVSIQMKKRKDNGNYKSYFDVSLVEKETPDSDWDDIPIIEDEEGQEFPPEE